MNGSNILSLGLSTVGHTGFQAWGDLPTGERWRNPALVMASL
ncbi:MAG: hypothetical protein SVX43_15705 [Cyanobacteriota bacterium]|nr:hypothetical protein [Cyanobacteriota bacterium]